jgi:hypothetical protein
MQLSRQGFSGLLTGKIHLDRLGDLQCGTRAYRVFFYEWEESHPPGEAIHAAYRVTFFDGDQYIGSYSIGDRPIRTIHESVLFSYPEGLGNRITCTEIGLGKQTVLNGEEKQFFK